MFTKFERRWKTVLFSVTETVLLPSVKFTLEPPFKTSLFNLISLNINYPLGFYVYSFDNEEY